MFKYPFLIEDRFEISLPDGARILHVESQYGQACLWALVDKTAHAFPVKFRLFGTGQPIEDADELEHVGTFFTHDGSFVWHLFRECVARGAVMD